MSDEIRPAPQYSPLLSGGEPISKEIKRKPVANSLAINQTEIQQETYEDNVVSRWKRFLRFLSGVDSWLWEIVAAVLSLAATVALLFVLRHIENQAQTSWTFKITPNTVISLLSTTARSSLLVAVTGVIGQEKWLWFGLGRTKGYRQGTRLIDLQIFDDASRGPLGSLNLLWLTQMRRLASVGALITLLSLAMDSFSQQVLEIKFRVAPSINNLTVLTNVQRSERYDAYTFLPQSVPGIAATIGGNQSVTVTLGMRAAIINGLLTGSIQNITFPCLTGDCKWPTIPTLAVCSECQDLTKQLKYESTSSPDIWKLPNGQQSIDSSDMNTTPSWYGDSNYYQDPVLPYLSILDIISTNAGNATAFECAIWFCIQAYNVTTNGGTQTQTLLSTWSEYIDSIPPTQTNDTAGASKRTETLLQSQDHIFQPPPAEFNTEPYHSYSVSNSALQAIAALLNNTFAGNPKDNSTSEGVQALAPTNSDFQNVSNLMANLALSMTNYIRLNPALTDESGNQTNPWHRPQYVGAAWTSQSYFHVRWAWIVLPVVVVVTACLYLWAAALENWVSGVRLWKGSLLPVLFFPLADGVRGNFSVFSTTHEMQEYAQTTRGSLT